MTPAPKNENLLRIVIVATAGKKGGKKVVETKQITTILGSKVQGSEVQRFKKRFKRWCQVSGVRCQLAEKLKN